ncbi:PQQ-binding-like beta-propeller repeat protein [Streptomyces sp. NRRL S-146]|uniref:outer membrane protein assembly factor BamB family protein n=1 Tax=Streptomyces sp. NRRL S-146 TaxID=1463884 RepID=UPI00131D45E6|nr:PQQ-binding-like beta-propeller repeat protein [Streptomyces sp. NRRL S-146]
MHPIRTTVALGLALSAGLVTGCSGGAEPNAKPGGGETGKVAESSAPASPKSPVYQGKPVAGLAAQPAWSLTADEAGNCASKASEGDTSQLDECTVGDAVIVTDSSGGQSGTSTFTARLLDAKSGKLRKKFDFALPAESGGTSSSPTLPRVQVGEWRDGSPALLIRNRVDTPASGLKKASTQTVLTMYAPSGEKLGSSSFDGDTHMSTPVRHGYLVDAGLSGGSVFTPIGDGEPLTTQASHIDLKGAVGSGLGYSSQKDISFQPSAEWLTATDIRTGKKAWNTKDLAPPATIAKLVTPDKATSARLMPYQGDKALLEWSSYGNSEAVMTLIDVKSGRRLAEGPGIDTNGTIDDDGLAISPDGKTAVVQYGKGAVAWNTETGKEMWRQAADEVNIKPGALPGNGVLYAYLDGTGAALDARDKKLLTSGIDEMPQFTTNGYATVRTAEGLFIFATQPV